MLKDRVPRWRAGTAPLLARLHAGQVAALKRAKGGFPPDHLLGWFDVADTGSGHEPPLRAIEEIARALLRAYPWPDPDEGAAWPPSGFREDITGVPGSWRPVGPDWAPDLARGGRLEYDPAHDRVGDWRVGGQPHSRFELLRLVQLVAELREALAAGLRESAVLRAMTIGMLFTRLAFLLLDGEWIARGAAIEFARPASHESRRENTKVFLAPRDAEIARLDTEICKLYPSLTSKKTRAKRLRPELAKWAARQPEKERPAVPSVDRISRMLPDRT